MEDAPKRQSIHNISSKMALGNDGDKAEVKALILHYEDNVKFLCTKNVQKNFEHAHGKNYSTWTIPKLSTA